MCITKRKQKAQKSAVLPPKSTVVPAPKPSTTPGTQTSDVLKDKKPTEKEKVAVAVAATVAEVVTKPKCDKNSKEVGTKSKHGELQDTQPDASSTQKGSKKEQPAIVAKAPDVSPPKVVHAKRAIKGMRETKDPEYATLDNDFPPFEMANLRGTSKENSRKIEPTQPSSNDENNKKAETPTNK